MDPGLRRDDNTDEGKKRMEPIVGSGKYTYRVNEEWQQPPEWLEVKACAVSVDSQDRVYCFNRNDAHPIVIRIDFDYAGERPQGAREGLRAPVSLADLQLD